MKTQFPYNIEDDNVGEYWAISAYENTSSCIINGRFKGLKLDYVYKNYRYLFGDIKNEKFPLLVKLIDSRDWLSVQVHPNDKYSAGMNNDYGKTECWYIIDADEKAEIIYGTTVKSIEDIKMYIQNNEWGKFLKKIKVKKGDFIYVPAGTIHAIGPGILILEIQQSSDITYRLYDFDRIDDITRKKRELHIKDAVNVINTNQEYISNKAKVKTKGFMNTVLVMSEYFTIYYWNINKNVLFEKTNPFLLMSIISGNGVLIVDNVEYKLKKGDHFILTSNIDAWEIDGVLEIVVSHI